MFNLLVSGGSTTWDVSQPWSIPLDRFKEYSGIESDTISTRQPETLKILEQVPTLLAYEWVLDGIDADIVRYGSLSHISVAGRSIQFRFHQERHCDRELVDEFAGLLALDDWERGRTHWAIKDGDVPRDMLRQMVEGPHQKFRYDVVLSYAGEEAKYVEQVASYLKERGIELFFAPSKEADLWGTDLTEELDLVFRKEGRYCVMFLSESYARKAWPTHERRSAMARAVQQQGRYVLPCRFDDTEVPGLSPSISYIDLRAKKPQQLAELIMEVLRKRRKGG